jgi:hypothetical protein
MLDRSCRLDNADPGRRLVSASALFKFSMDACPFMKSVAAELDDASATDMLMSVSGTALPSTVAMALCKVASLAALEAEYVASLMPDSVCNP